MSRRGVAEAVDRWEPQVTEAGFALLILLPGV